MFFYIYKASAGSGKTYTLVKEYLKLALQDDDPGRFRKILALTFTNKAAAEMKERVIRVLHSIVQPVDDGAPEISLVNDLSKELNVSTEKVRQRAAKTLSSVLHNYSDFSIGTIDSFMHRVVKTFAHDLNLPVNFSVEMDQDVLLQQAIDQIMEQVGTNPGITKALVGFTEHRTDEEKNLSVQEELFKTARDLLQEHKSVIIRRLQHLTVEDFLKIRGELSAFCRDFETRMRKIGSAAMLLIKSENLVAEDFYYGTKGIMAWFRKLEQYGNGALIPLNSYQQKTISENTWYLAKTPVGKMAAIDKISGELKTLALSAIDFEKEQGAEYTLQFMLKDTLFTVALLNEISRVIDQIRDEQFVVHISEFNRRVAEIVFSEPAPFIFERLGDRYQHFLIDEFQDTSVLQWQNLLPLIQNGLSENAPSLIVGDGKQAIYRFRGGDVEQFAQLPEHYPETLEKIQKDRYLLIKEMHQHKTLGTNYRSKPEIIGFNNRFYSFLSENILPPAFSSVYAEHEQKSPSDIPGGYVRLETVPADLSRDERDLEQLERVLRIVRELTNQKGYQLSDIAILTRKNTEGTMIARHLLNSRIAVISNESLLVASSAEVRMLIAWLRVLTGENLEVNLMHICAYLVDRERLPYNSLDTLLRAIRMEERNVLELLGNHGMILSLFELRTLSLLEACNKLCRIFGFEIQDDPYLQFFLEAVWNMGKQNSPDIPQFLEYWVEKSETLSIALPQGANAVRIMTVHKSKGLQFPVVILPFAYSERPKNVREWVHDEERLPEGLPVARLSVSKQLENTSFSPMVEAEENRKTLDALNLQYVATTRPEDALYIISGRSGIKGSLMKGWEQNLELFALTEKPSEFANGVCDWGDENFRNERKEKKDQKELPVVFPYKSGEWQKRITITRMASKLWDVDGETSAIGTGKLMHLALSWVGHSDEIDAAVVRLSEEGLASADECVIIKSNMQRLVNHPQLKAWFEKGQRVRNERSLLLPDGNVLRPDRVMEKNDEAIVIDYKTGMPRNEHKRQVSEYLEMMRRMPYKNVKGFLVYLGEEIGVEEVR